MLKLDEFTEMDTLIDKLSDLKYFRKGYIDYNGNEVQTGFVMFHSTLVDIPEDDIGFSVGWNYIASADTDLEEIMVNEDIYDSIQDFDEERYISAIRDCIYYGNEVQNSEGWEQQN